jgi:FAS-associated factor 2
MLMPRDTASRFRREFEEKYGHHDLPFFEDGFAQAHDVAKRDLKFLLIVLMSPEHDETDSFIRDTLLAPELVSFLNDPSNDVILWGGNVLDSEAYQVSLEYNCTKYPFSALICLTPKEGSTKMGIIKRMVGPMPAATYLSEVQTAINKYAPDLAGVREERKVQEVARTLRNQQDSAYERSLARDRERARQRREEATAAAAAERKAKDEAASAAIMEAKRQQWKSWRASLIAPEPVPSVKDVVRIALKMPESSGAGRIVRRFNSDTTLEELYAFVECYDLLESGTASLQDSVLHKPDDYTHEYQFRVASLMPRAVYEPTELVTMGEQIGRSGNLIVESLGDESDGEKPE